MAETTAITMRSLRTTAVTVIVGLLLACAVATTAGAQEPPPTVTTDALDGAVTAFTGCDGETATSVNVGFAAIRRPDGTSGALSVDVSYGGALEAGVDYEPLPDPVVLGDGEASAILAITPTRPGNVTVTIEPGDGYLVGQPATSTVEFPLMQAVADCALPLGLPDPPGILPTSCGTTGKSCQLGRGSTGPRPLRGRHLSARQTTVR